MSVFFTIEGEVVGASRRAAEVRPTPVGNVGAEDHHGPGLGDHGLPLHLADDVVRHGPVSGLHGEGALGVLSLDHLQAAILHGHGIRRNHHGLVELLVEGDVGRGVLVRGEAPGALQLVVDLLLEEDGLLAEEVRHHLGELAVDQAPDAVVVREEVLGAAEGLLAVDILVIEEPLS